VPQRQLNHDGTIKPAMFDSRAWVLPKEEVCNYFLWHQQDATRNSIQMLARSIFSHKQCDHKNNSQLQEMLFQKEIKWNDCPTEQKRGRCVVEKLLPKNMMDPKTGELGHALRSEWIVDNEIPVLSQDRQYIEQYL
jgi:tRNA(His) guanylyltransferase